MITAIVELKLVYPYIQSLLNLFDFINLWGCSLVSAKTLSPKAVISIPANKFKILFGENPRKGKYRVPDGADYFMEEAIVKEVVIK